MPFADSESASHKLSDLHVGYSAREFPKQVRDDMLD
jgi:hypothetical protein